MGNIADALQKAGVDLVDNAFEPEEIPVKGVSSQVSESKEDSRKENPSPQPQPTHRKMSLSGTWEERIDMVANRSPIAAEAFRILRSNILFPKDGKARPRSILVTSSAPGEGKSFVSVNLAIAMARGVDQYSLLVDGDLRRPTLAKLLGLKDVAKRGLSDYLLDDVNLQDLIYRTSETKLSLLPSGAPPVNPAELLTSARMKDLVVELSDRYADRLIIFDSPPYQVASESAVLAKAVDGVVLVVGYGKSDRTQIRSMVEEIGSEKICGIIFNGMKSNYLKNKLFDHYGKYRSYYSSKEQE